MPRRLFATAAWLTLAFIAYATLSPVGLRPHITNPDLERFAAFAVLGFLFAISYPGRFIPVLAIVIGAAVLLEVLQLFTPDRDGEFVNLAVKAAGSIAGVSFAHFISYSARRGLEKSE